MVIRRFSATSARLALQQVRDALGADALILANRPCAAGVEILALSGAEAARLEQPAATGERGESGGREARGPAGDAAGTPAPAAAPRYDLLQEVRQLRSVVEGQLSALAWGEINRGAPARAEILRRLLRSGFSPPLCRLLGRHLPAGCDVARGLRWAKSALQGRLRVPAARESLFERGGVYALVGPTGVGKTTTVAKLAAQCILARGRGQVALVTTDAYRIGAAEQLHTYGRILRVPVYAVRGEADLQAALEDLRSRHLVLVDTAGMSQRDRRLAEQIALLAAGGRQVQRLLLVAAQAQWSVLEEVLRAYGGDGPALAGCILTKLDEAPSLGAALDLLVRSGLPLHFVANGQRVPEDLHAPSPLYLVERAFRMQDAGALEESDYPMLLAEGGVMPVAMAAGVR